MATGKKLLFCFLLLTFSFFAANSQTIRYEIQAGLSEKIKKAIPLDKPNQLLVVTDGGSFMIWNAGENKIFFQDNIEEEIYDVAFLPSGKLVLISTPTQVHVFRLELQKMIFLYSRSFENPTSLSVDGDNVLIACNDQIKKVSFTESGAVELQNIETGESAVYALQKVDDKVILLNNGGLKVFDFSSANVNIDTSFKISDDTSSITTDIDTSSVTAVDNTGAVVKPIFAIDGFNTGWYANFWDSKAKRIYAAKENSILIFDYSDDNITYKEMYLPVEREELVTGIAIVNDTLFVGTRSGYLFTAGVSENKNVFGKAGRLSSQSITFLSNQNSLLLGGDFYGGIYLFDPVTLQEVAGIDPDETPGLTGVYLNKETRMVTTHKGPKGAVIRIWDIKNVNLSYSCNIKAMQVSGVSFRGDTIITQHVDGAMYKFIPRVNSYDTVRLKAPVTPYVVGAYINRPGEEPMLITKEQRDEIANVTDPGLHQWKSKSSKYVFNYNISASVKCDKMPPYSVVQSFYRQAGLIPYIQHLDVMDQDLFFMSACRHTLQRFEEKSKEYKVPFDKALNLYKLLHQSSTSQFFLTTTDKSDTLFNIPVNKLEYFSFDKSSEKIFAAFDSSFLVFNPKNRQIFEIKGGILPSYFHYALNEKWLAVGSSQEVRLFAINKNQTVTSWLGFGDDDFLVSDKSGYFRTRGRSTRLSAFKDNEIIPFKYFDLTFNRPDTIIQEVNGNETPMSLIFKKAVQKRADRFGKKDFKYAVDSGISEQLTDLEFPLTVNHSLFEFKLPENVRELDWTVSVNGVVEKQFDPLHPRLMLSTGLNKIDWEVSSIKTNQIYSLMTNYIMNKETQAQNWYYLGAGIDHYADTSLNLRYAGKDVRDMASLLKKGVPGITIDTLFDEKVSRQQFMRWKENISHSTVNDVIIVSLSGHGFLNDMQQFCFASPGSTSLNFMPAVTYDELLDVLDAAPARKKLLLIDACHSGLIDSDSVEQQPAKGVTAKAFGRKDGNINVSSEAFKLMQEEFMDLSKHNGTIVITASAGREFAMESTERRNGLFTYALINGLFNLKADKDRNNRITVSEIQSYLDQQVQRLSGGGQKPSARQENWGIDWVIWPPVKN